MTHHGNVAYWEPVGRYAELICAHGQPVMIAVHGLKNPIEGGELLHSASMRFGEELAYADEGWHRDEKEGVRYRRVRRAVRDNPTTGHEVRLKNGRVLNADGWSKQDASRLLLDRLEAERRHQRKPRVAIGEDGRRLDFRTAQYVLSHGEGRRAAPARSGPREIERPAPAPAPRRAAPPPPPPAPQGPGLFDRLFGGRSLVADVWAPAKR